MDTMTFTAIGNNISVSLVLHYDTPYPTVSIAVDGIWASSGRYDPRSGQVYDAPGDLDWDAVDRLAAQAYATAMAEV